MNLFRFAIIVAIVLLLAPAELAAQDGMNSTTGMNILFGAAIFLVILACFFVASRIFSFLRGGELASGWQMLAIAFIVLCISQLLDISASLELFSLNNTAVQAFRLVGVAVLMLGFIKIKNALS